MVNGCHKHTYSGNDRHFHGLFKFGQLGRVVLGLGPSCLFKFGLQ